MRAEPQAACPKCGYARRATDVAPAWQCPACGIAYNKFGARLAQTGAAAKRAVIPPALGDLVPPITLDASVWSLIAANALALAVAVFQKWPAQALMLLYWGQSIVIGLSYMLRMLSLDKFSTENFKMNDQPVEPTTATKIHVTLFFAVHYGIFHAVYLMFIFADARGTITFDKWFWACTAAFALNHLWSYRYNRDLDRRGTPNIGTLMVTPYIRIVPMHLTIIVGGFFSMIGFPAISLLLFVGLKTVADVGTHVVEHQVLQKSARDAGGEKPGG